MTAEAYPSPAQSAATKPSTDPAVLEALSSPINARSVTSPDRHSMGQAVVTFKVMPESPEVDLDSLEDYAKEQIQEQYEPSELKVKREPVAFGLKSLVIQFTMDEEQGNTDDLEATMNDHEDVRNAETTDVRRAFG